MTKKLPHSLLYLSILCAFPTITHADELACRISPLDQYLINNYTSEREDHIEGYIELYGDEGEMENKIAHLRGNVFVDDGKNIMQGSSLTYDFNTEIISSNERTQFSDEELVVESEKFIHYKEREVTELDDARYYSAAQKAQGVAKRMVHSKKEEKSELTEATYSTCPVDKEKWKISAKDLVLDHEAGRGIAKNASFSLFGKKVLATPYISFPLDDRRHSGFLSPHLAWSKEDGVAVEIPYYFNIAPNMDATLTTGLYTSRGIKLGGELRYLNRWQQFSLNGSYLPNDRNYNKQDRWSISFNQSLRFTPKLTGRIEYRRVSDKDYPNDFNNSLSFFDTTNLKHLAEFTYREKNWRATLRFEDAQIVNRVSIPNKPYARLPQLTFNGNWRMNGVDYGVEAEAVQFKTENWRERDFRPTSAKRTDVTLHAKHRFENLWGFFEPRIALRNTQYFELDYTNERMKNRDEKERSFSRTLPIASIDTGIFLERETSFKNLFGGGNFTQTLEPRLFYLYVPYRSQGDIPRFDTSNLTPTYSNLFKHNRFNSADRQGDANQITTALTTRFIDDQYGREKFALSVGKIHHFVAPRVTLTRDLNEEEAKEYQPEWFVEGHSMLLRDLYSDFSFEWSPNSKKINRTTLDLRYQPSPRQVINLGYRYNSGESQLGSRTRLEQIDLNGFWEINSRWAVVGRYNYSIENKAMIDTYAGVEFNDCCMTTRLVGRYYRDNPADEERKWKAYLQVEFKGLSTFGQSTQSLWYDTIPGYQPVSF